MKSRSHLLVLAAFGLVYACGGEDAARPAPKPASAPAEEATPAPSAGSSSRRGSRSSGSSDAKVEVVVAGDPGGAGGGRITGAVLLSGDPPQRREIGAVRNTEGCNHDGGLLDEKVIADGGKLQNVFVYVSKGLSGWDPTPVDSEPFLMDQKGCVYTPHVSGLRAGRSIKIRNSDAISHNVHVIATRNEAPNQTQGAGALPLELTWEAEEVPVTLVCDIHPWMKAYVCVVEHPFFAVTGPDGSFAIDDVPPGEYTLTAWHERYKKQKGDLTVTAGGEVSVEFTYDAD